MNDFYDVGICTGTMRIVEHGYHPHYEAHLGSFRNATFSILEIGVWKGEGLRWLEQLFPKAKIYGIDIDPEAAKYASEHSTIYVGNQSDPEFLKWFLTQVDSFGLIIDDGSHLPNDQKISFEILVPALEVGGWYVIEDLMVNYWANEFSDRHLGKEVGYRNPKSFIEYLKQSLDSVHTHYHGNPVYPVPLSEVHMYPKICFLRR